MIFDQIQNRARMEEIGMKLERAMQDVNIIVQHPEVIKDVKYETSEDGTIFNKEGPSFIMLKIEYEDVRGFVAKEKKGFLDDSEKELMAELEKIKKEKERYE